MEEFEKLLADNTASIERYIHYKITNHSDAEDIIQDVYITAFQKFNHLQNKEKFKPWLIAIARNKCNDYYRKKAKMLEISIDDISESTFTCNIYGKDNNNAVNDTLSILGYKEKQILYLYYFLNIPQSEIAKRLNIPIGTVKSRLFNAKKCFKSNYPYHFQSKEDYAMSKLPELLPKYKITKLDKEPFSAKWEELMGWLIVPKLNEKLCWGIYDAPSNRLSEYTNIEVVGKAEVHSIEGVEIKAVQYNAANKFDTGSVNKLERTFVAQLTETHSRYLAESHLENGIKKCYTFLDGEAFLKNWGYGTNNCGNETNIKCKNLINRNNNIIHTVDIQKCQDVVGRYKIEINKKTYDTICIMNVEYFDDGILIEQYIDKNGKTVLWKRYNKNDWNFGKYNKLWNDILPKNDTLIVNNQIFVHWYDCISDYIFK